MIFNSVIVGSGGGGTGATVKAKAIGDTYHYGEGVKVILTPTGLVYSSSYKDSGVLTNANQASLNFQPNNGGVLTRTQARFFNKWDRNDPGYTQLYATYGEDFSNYTGVMNVNTGGSGTHFVLADYRDDNTPIGTQMSITNYWPCDYIGMGVINRSTGSYTQSVAAGGSRPGGARCCYANKHGCLDNGYAVEFDSNYAATRWQVANNRGTLPSYFNGSWYGISGTSVYPWGSSTASYTFTPGTYEYGTTFPWYPVDDEWTYLFWLNNSSSRYEFVKINKSSNSAWTITALTQPNLEISGVESDNSSREFMPVIKCKDFGDYVEIFYMSVRAKAPDLTSEVAHFKFIKATETLERLPDVFTGAGANWSTNTWTDGMQVNWQDRLVSLAVSSIDYATSPYHQCRVYVAKYDEDAGIYKYYVYSYTKENFYPGCMTGLVKENKGVNVIGDWILEVETIEDPEYIFDNSGVLYGMEVTINPGI